MKQGFTLIEMAMVLLIVGLLVGSFVIPLGAQMDINNIKATDQRLAQIKEALLGYAARNRRLPCPASDATTGIEDTNALNCSKRGWLPWANLNMEGRDAWGRYFIYRIDNAHISATAYNVTIPTTTNALSVVNKAGTTTLTTGAVAIIFSAGKNGNSEKLNIFNDIVDSTDQTYTQDDFVPNDFDDRLIWLSDNELVSRLAAAGFRIK